MADNQEFTRLLKVISALNQELANTQSRIEALQKSFSKSGAEEFNRALAIDKIKAEELAVALERAKAAKAALSAGGSASTRIPGGAPATGKPAGEAGIRAQLEAEYQMQLKAEKLNTRMKNKELSETEKLRLERLALEAERIRQLQATINLEKNAQVKARAIALGFNPETDLKKVSNRGTGIDRFQFSRTTDDGVQQNSDLYRSQSGRVTPGISNQFRTFGQGVVRDIGELTKWSIALAAVYGPLKKLQELTQIMIENQSKLAEATIVVNSSFLDSAGIFDIAADAANRSGEEITGVIDAFTAAYRAAGGTGTEVERLAIATQLLSDSLLLAKLSTLDQAGAIDVLSAAVRQTGGNFSTTTELLDKWVRVTKIANVDLATLATGFAVLGDAAEAAGIGTNELNGIIAAISESTESGGKEVANQARALVSGFQSDTARKELENLGIAVEDTSGKMRPFLEIMQEIYNLRQNEIIDDTQFSKLTLALGGGVRRQSVYTTFIENFDRVFTVANESSKASGDAEAALAKQTETVQTALTRMSNAFEELAQTMGTEGGFLSIITTAVNGLTSLVKIFDGLTSSLGKATPAMVAFIAASAVLKYRGSGGLQEAVGGLVPQQTIYNDPLRQEIYGRGTKEQSKRSNLIGQNIFGTNGISGAFQGLAVSAIPALLNATNKEDRYGGVKAGADILGGVAGGVIGSLVAGSPIVGAAIGTAISEAFVNNTIARKTDLFGYQNAPVVGDTTRRQQDLVKDPRKALQEAEIDLFRSIGGGSEAIGKLLSYNPAAERSVGRANELITGGDQKAFERFLKQIAPGAGSSTNKTVLENAGITEKLLRDAFSQGKEIQFSPENAVYNKASTEARRAYDEALAAYNASQTGGGGEITNAFSELTNQNKQAFDALITSIKETSTQGLSQQRLSGDLKGTQYTGQLSALQGFDVKALQYYTAMGDAFIELNKDVNNANDAFEAFALITTKGSQESVTELTRITAEIEKLINVLDDPALHEAQLEDYGGIDAARKQLEDLQQTGGNLLTDVYNQARLSQTNIPNIQGDRQKPLQKGEFNQVVQLATQLQEQFYQGFLDIPDELYDGMKKGFDEWAQIVEDSGEAFYQTVSELDPQFFEQALQKLIEENKIQSQGTGFGLQKFDVDRATLESLAAQSISQGNQWAQQFPGFETKQEDLLAITNEGLAKPIHADFRILALLLEKIVDQNQKQLDGQYNIPEGATFWVPLTAAYYRPQNEGGIGGAGAIDTSPLDASANNLDGAAIALKSAADAMAQKFAAQPKTAEFEKAYLEKAKIGDPLYGNVGTTGGREAPRATALQLNEYQQYRSSEQQNYEKLPDSTSSLDFKNVLDLSGITSAIETIKNLFDSLSNSFSTITPQASGQEADKSLSAKLDFRVDSTTNLNVDGRVLASIITPYLASDLLKIEASQGTITKRYII